MTLGGRFTLVGIFFQVQIGHITAIFGHYVTFYVCRTQNFGKNAYFHLKKSHRNVKWAKLNVSLHPTRYEGGGTKLNTPVHPPNEGDSPALEDGGGLPPPSTRKIAKSVIYLLILLQTLVP